MSSSSKSSRKSSIAKRAAQASRVRKRYASVLNQLPPAASTSQIKLSPPRGVPVHGNRPHKVSNHQDLLLSFTSSDAQDMPADFLVPAMKEDGPLETIRPEVPPPTKTNLPKDLVSLTDWRLRAVSRTGKDLPWAPKRMQASQRILQPDTSQQGLNSIRKYTKDKLHCITLDRNAVLKEATERLAVMNPSPDQGLILFDVQLLRSQALYGQREQTKDGHPIYRCRASNLKQELPKNSFKLGMAVLISEWPRTAAATVEHLPHWTGHIVNVTAHFLEIAIDPASIASTEINIKRCRIDHAFDDHYGSQIAAVEALHLDRQAQKDEQAYYDSKSNYEYDSNRTSIIQQGSDLRDLIVPPINLTLLDKLTEAKDKHVTRLFKDDQRLWSWIQRHSFLPAMPMPGDPTLSTLNPKQVQAIAIALSSRISNIQGPPGTGKSFVIANIINLLKRHFQSPIPILVCAPTHAAVDHLTAAIGRMDLNPVRLGHFERVRQDCTQFAYDILAEKHHLAPNLNWVKRIQDAKKKFLQESGIQVDLIQAGRPFREQLVELDDDSQDIHKIQATFESWRKLNGYIKEQQRNIRRDIFWQNDVIVSTAMGAMSARLDEMDFPLVLLDEAAQCNETTSLIPLNRGSEQAILIGDHRQLQSICTSPEAEAAGYTSSLFERLIEEKVEPVPSVMLEQQYRMAPDIVAFPNLSFYQSKLVTAPITVRSSLTDPIHPETFAANSRQNRGEMEVISSILEDLFALNPFLTAADVGIITPYSAQTKFLKDIRHYLTDILTMRLNLEQIMVNTVDSFQGQEKKCIILSTVRSNSSQSIGFLSNPRRLNVALTRAQKALIVVGNQETLAGDKRSASDIWSRFMDWIKAEDLVINFGTKQDSV